MSSLWTSTITSLDDSLALLGTSLEKLKAAVSVDITEGTEQLKTATESARNLRALVLSELPEASWQNREELNASSEDTETYRGKDLGATSLPSAGSRDRVGARQYRAPSDPPCKSTE